MTHVLFASGSKGTSQLTGAGTGVVAAQWGPGDILTVRGDYLWLAASGESTPTASQGPCRQLSRRRDTTERWIGIRCSPGTARDVGNLMDGLHDCSARPARHRALTGSFGSTGVSV